EEIAQIALLVATLGDIAKHGEKIVGLEVTGNAEYLPLRGRPLRQLIERLGKELDRGGEADLVFGGEIALGEVCAVEIGDGAVAPDVELQNIEVRAHVIDDVRAGKVDQVHFLAIRAAPELPHHGQALARLGGILEIVGKLEQAFQVPRLPVKAVLGENRRLGASARAERHRGRAAEKELPSCRHTVTGSLPGRDLFVNCSR